MKRSLLNKCGLIGVAIAFLAAGFQAADAASLKKRVKKLEGKTAHYKVRASETSGNYPADGALVEECTVIHVATSIAFKKPTELKTWFEYSAQHDIPSGKHTISLRITILDDDGTLFSSQGCVDYFSDVAGIGMISGTRFCSIGVNPGEKVVVSVNRIGAGVCLPDVLDSVDYDIKMIRLDAVKPK